VWETEFEGGIEGMVRRGSVREARREECVRREWSLREGGGRRVGWDILQYRYHGEIRSNSII
jgi:hypothetical protein